MAWNISFLVIHLLYLAGVIALYRHAPCWMQKVTLFGLGITMVLMSIGYAAGAAGYWWSWHIMASGLAIEHLAVMIYIFRLIYQQHLQWKPSSAHFPSL